MKRKNWISAIVVMIVAVAFLVPASGFSADRARAHDRQQLQDGSCQDDSLTATRTAVGEPSDKGDRIQDQIQLQDPIQDKLQEKLQDGSCKEE